MMNIIFFVTMYPGLFFIFFVYKIQYKPNDNYLFAVSMKKEWLEEKAVQDIITSFKKQMNVSLLILMVLPLLSLLSEHISIQFSIWMLWLLLMIFMLFIPFPIANHKLKEWKKEQHFYQNEDNHWIGGFLYYNPKDHHTLIEKRVGIGTTVNMATPLGKGLTIFSVLALLFVPLSCVFLIMEEFTPIALRIVNDTLYAQHIRVDYEILIEDIENANMIDELPSWSKSSGTAMDNLEKGDFHIRNHGKCKVFLNPQNDTFICFTANGTEYYVSGFDDAQTEHIYEQITNE